MSAKYAKLTELLRNLIEENAGIVFKLPTEDALCKKYSVSRQTVRKALSVLEREHLIEKRRGSGSYTTGLSGRAERNTVAVLVCSDSEYIYPEFLTALRNAFQQQGFSCTVYVTDNLFSKEREILAYLLAHPVRGILSEGCKTAFPTPNDDLYRRLQNEGASIVFFHGNYPNLPDLPSIKDDNFEGAYCLGKYLLSAGHKKTAAVLKSDDIQGVERCCGFLSALRDEHIPFPEENICYFDSARLSALQKKRDTGFLADFIGKQLDGATAVLCYNDEIAYWLIKELTYKNMRVPEDLSVVSFDNSYLSELSAVQIASLSHKKQEMALSAAEMLLKLMKGFPVSSRKLSWHLVRRQSCAAPRT